MDAFFARNRLSAYLDGELTAAEARDVEAALGRDPALRRELEELRAAVELLRDGGVVDAPPGFADRLAVRLEREPMPVGWRRWVRELRPEALMLAAAAVLVVIYVGNREDLPNLDPVGADQIVAGKAFGDRKDAPADAEPPPADASAAADPSEPAPAGYATAADGVLGNEPAKKVASSDKQAASKSQSLAERLPTPRGTAKESGSVEPWKAEWEMNPDEGIDTPALNTATNTAQFFSPPPFRYRIVVRNDLALKELAKIAKELGGELQNSQGRPIAAFQLDAGTTESVRVAVPAHNWARLAERLRELGEVVTLKESGNLVTDPNTDVPMAVELQLQ